MSGNRAVLDLKGICTAFKASDLEVVSSGNTQTTTTSKPTVGATVRVKSGAKSYEGKNVAVFVYNGKYKVDELKGDRAVLDKKGICTAFRVSDLEVL